MTSQGPINPHSMEHLGTLDRGVVLFRCFVRQGIQAVEEGRDPQGFFMTQEDVAPTFANDYIVEAASIGGNPDDPAFQRRFAEELAARYREEPPMRRFVQDRLQPA